MGSSRKASICESHHPCAMDRALSHAQAIGGDDERSFNLLFRGGPCDICGGCCLSALSDRSLSERLLAGLKPAGTYARQSKWHAWALSHVLEERGLTTWRGKNRWGMHVVVATAEPDKPIPQAGGTPREVAFTQEFIDEALPFSVIGPLYGYPACGLY